MFFCSEADKEPERPLYRSVPDPLREDRPHREGRRGHADGGGFIALHSLATGMVPLHNEDTFSH